MVREKACFSILYMEDDEEDAREFAEEIKPAIREITGEEERSVLKNRAALIAFFEKWGIKWVCSEDAFWKETRKKEYRLLVIDLFFDDKKDATGMALIEKLEDHPVKGDPLIWVLSRLSHYRMSMTKYARVHRFFCKEEEDFSNMRALLLKLFGSQRESTDGELEFLDSYNGKLLLRVSQIISIDVTSVGNDKQYRQRRICRFNPDKAFAKIDFIGGRYDLIKDVLKQINTKNIRDLVQVSRTVIINTRYISKIEMRERIFYLTMSQCGENKENQIKVGDAYKASLSKALGMKLF